MRVYMVIRKRAEIANQLDVRYVDTFQLSNANPMPAITFSATHINSRKEDGITRNYCDTRTLIT